MKNFSIKASLKRGWALFRINWKKLVASTFIAMVIWALMNVVSQGSRGYGLSSLIIWVAILLAGTILKIGLTKMYLKLVDGEPIALRELFSYSRLLLKYLGATLLYALIVGVGTILLIIPGIYFMLKYIFVPVIIVDDYMTIGEAFKRSAEMTKGHKWHLLGFLIIFGIINLLGLVVVFVGLFVSLPVSMAAFIDIYRKLEKPVPEVVTA